MHYAFIALWDANNLLDQVFVWQVLFTVSTSNTTFWWALQTQTEWVIFESVRTNHWVSRYRTLKTQNLRFGVFLWKQYIILASYKVLFMYCFTHSDIAFLSRHLFTETVIFISACYQMKCCIWEQVLLMFHLPFWFHVRFIRYSKTLCSEHYFRDHLSGTKVRIWNCSEYDTMVNFSCIVSCNLTKSFAFFSISFLS